MSRMMNSYIEIGACLALILSLAIYSAQPVPAGIPANVHCDSKWRKIKVLVKPPRGLPQLTVRAKEGYYALP